MVEYEIICNCGNRITYSSDVPEEKIITCDNCSRQIKVLNYSNKIEVHFL
jgi:hypothetical protein